MDIFGASPIASISSRKKYQKWIQARKNICRFEFKPHSICDVIYLQVKCKMYKVHYLLLKICYYIFKYVLGLCIFCFSLWIRTLLNLDVVIECNMHSVYASKHKTFFKVKRGLLLVHANGKNEDRHVECICATVQCSNDFTFIFFFTTWMNETSNFYFRFHHGLFFNLLLRA